MDFSENDLIFRHALIMRAAFYFGEILQKKRSEQTYGKKRTNQRKTQNQIVERSDVRCGDNPVIVRGRDSFRRGFRNFDDSCAGLLIEPENGRPDIRTSRIRDSGGVVRCSLCNFEKIQVCLLVFLCNLPYLRYGSRPVENDSVFQSGDNALCEHRYMAQSDYVCFGRNYNLAFDCAVF